MQGYHWREDLKEVKEQVKGMSRGRGNSSPKVSKVRVCLAFLRNSKGSHVIQGKRGRVVEVRKEKAECGRRADYVRSF